MSLNNIKKMQSERGFTIVELLIVIVVIGILAAIVIVAYTGVTNKANQAAAKGNAEGVQKVAEAYNADKGEYATDATVIAGATNLTAKMPANVNVDTTIVTSADATGKHITYVGKADKTGGCVAYWDVLKSGGAGIQYIGVGSATGTISSGTCS